MDSLFDDVASVMSAMAQYHAQDMIDANRVFEKLEARLAQNDRVQMVIAELVAEIGIPVTNDSLPDVIHIPGDPGRDATNQPQHTQSSETKPPKERTWLYDESVESQVPERFVRLSVDSSVLDDLAKEFMNDMPLPKEVSNSGQEPNTSNAQIAERKDILPGMAQNVTINPKKRPHEFSQSPPKRKGAWLNSSPKKYIDSQTNKELPVPELMDLTRSRLGNVESNVKLLSELFPDADQEYLRMRCELLEDERALNGLVERMLTTGDFPRCDYWTAGEKQGVTADIHPNTNSRWWDNPGVSAAAGSADRPGVSAAMGFADRPGVSAAMGSADRPGVSAAMGSADRPGVSAAAGSADRSGVSAAAGSADRPGVSAAAGLADRPGVCAAAGSADRPGPCAAAGYVERRDVSAAAGFADRRGVSAAVGSADRPGVSAAAGSANRPGVSAAAGSANRPGVSAAAGSANRPGASAAVGSVNRPSVAAEAALVDIPGASAAVGSANRPGVSGAAGAERRPGVSAAVGSSDRHGGSATTGLFNGFKCTAVSGSAVRPEVSAERHEAFGAAQSVVRSDVGDTVKSLHGWGSNATGGRIVQPDAEGYARTAARPEEGAGTSATGPEHGSVSASALKGTVRMKSPKKPKKNSLPDHPDRKKGQQQDGAVAGPSGLSGNQSPPLPQRPPWEPWREQLDTFLSILPDADPTYLEEKAKALCGKEEELKQFVADALENKTYPSRKDWEWRKEQMALIKKYKDEFSVENFLEVIPDPFAHFGEANKKFNRDLGAMFLRNKYRTLRITEITKAFIKFNYNLTLTCRYLDVWDGAKMKSRRADVAYDITPKEVGKTVDVPFLQEVAFIENEAKIVQFLEGKKERRRAAFEMAKAKGELLECQCCFDDEVLSEDICTCTEGHTFCKECVRNGAETRIGDGKTTFPCLADCNAEFKLHTLQEVLKPTIFSRLVQRKQAEEVKAAGIEDLVQCPFCDFCNIPPREDKVFRCLNPDCMKESCRLCKEENHVPLRCDEVEKAPEVEARKFIEDKMTEALVRTCWKCNKKFVKEDGCNKMTCQCGAMMCYVCRQPVKDYSHFNGQGGDAYEKCPLYSDHRLLEVEEVKKMAEQAKRELAAKKPNIKLKYDPTNHLPTYTPRQPNGDGIVGFDYYDSDESFDGDDIVDDEVDEFVDDEDDIYYDEYNNYNYRHVYYCHYDDEFYEEDEDDFGCEGEDEAQGENEAEGEDDDADDADDEADGEEDDEEDDEAEGEEDDEADDEAEGEEDDKEDDKEDGGDTEGGDRSGPEDKYRADLEDDLSHEDGSDPEDESIIFTPDTEDEFDFE